MGRYIFLPESNNSKIRLGPIFHPTEVEDKVVESRHHASALGQCIDICEGINMSLLEYSKVLRSDYSGPVHVVRTTTMTYKNAMTCSKYVVRMSGGDKQIE
jgi:hypothetical protein